MSALGGQRHLPRAVELSLHVVLVAAALAVVGFVLVELRVVVLPVIAALFLATLLVPPTRWLGRRGCPNALAAVAVMAAGIGVLVAIIAAIAPRSPASSTISVAARALASIR